MTSEDAQARSRLTRMRSNSKSNGSSAPPSPPAGATTVNETGNSGANKGSGRGVLPPVRNRYTHIIVLKSLNSTFETKFLVVPFKPDGLKLGRPVVNSSGSNGGEHGVNAKDVQPHVRPDNGHFDSRVLSRNHASLSCDGESGKIYIRDLKSSNGTFINGTRIGQADVELKIGDVVDLGTDIDAKFEHRKISALVEDISVIPLIHEDLGTIVAGGNANGVTSDGIYKLLGAGIDASHMAASNAQRAAFEAAMFGDVNNLDLEEAVLGSETEILSGIFINNSIGTSPNLINVIKTLITELTLEQTEYLKLKSIENFLINFTNNQEYLNKLRIEQNDAKLVQLQFTLKQKLTEKHEKLLCERNTQLTELQKERDQLKKSLDQKNQEANNELENLRRELDDVNTRLEVEKYKNTQISKKFEKGDPVKEAREKREHLARHLSGVNFGTKNMLVFGTVTIGIFAAAIKYITSKGGA
ncbi:AaceriAGL106Cp [[Ashbya] aceris (nom. inval.)]|nr:AaceriAGL106Cp [[Ashbya] aceris (nom. inval.)]